MKRHINGVIGERFKWMLAVLSDRDTHFSDHFSARNSQFSLSLSREIRKILLLPRTFRIAGETG